MTEPPFNSRYQRRFVRWGDRAANAPAAARAAQEVTRQLRELNTMFDRHQADSVVAEAEALCAADVRETAAFQAAQAARDERRRRALDEGWAGGDPGE